jgi:hypothetical protein
MRPVSLLHSGRSERNSAAGFEEPLVATRAGRLRFRARRPGGQMPR